MAMIAIVFSALRVSRSADCSSGTAGERSLDPPRSIDTRTPDAPGPRSLTAWTTYRIFNRRTRRWRRAFRADHLFFSASFDDGVHPPASFRCDRTPSRCLDLIQRAHKTSTFAVQCYEPGTLHRTDRLRRRRGLDENSHVTIIPPLLAAVGRFASFTFLVIDCTVAPPEQRPGRMPTGAGHCFWEGRYAFHSERMDDGCGVLSDTGKGDPGSLARPGVRSLCLTGGSGGGHEGTTALRARPPGRPPALGADDQPIASPVRPPGDVRSAAHHGEQSRTDHHPGAVLGGWDHLDPPALVLGGVPRDVRLQHSRGVRVRGARPGERPPSTG